MMQVGHVMMRMSQFIMLMNVTVFSIKLVIVFVFVMPHVLRLGGRALMRAVRSDR